MKARPTQYGPTRSRLTKEQGAELKGPPELAEGDLISVVAASRLINANSVDLYVAERRLCSWCGAGLIPCKSYQTGQGRNRYLLYRKHVAYLKEFLCRISKEEPTTRSIQAEKRAAAESVRAAAPKTTGPVDPVRPEPGRAADRPVRKPSPEPFSKTPAPTGEQLRIDFPEPAEPAKAVFDVLKINGRLEEVESALKVAAKRIGEIQEHLNVLQQASSGKHFALKELWENVADLRKEFQRRKEEEEAELAERLHAMDQEAKGLYPNLAAAESIPQTKGF